MRNKTQWSEKHKMVSGVQPVAQCSNPAKFCAKGRFLSPTAQL
jgi:hypothetical protein